MNTLTKIKRLALALCLATPFVSQAATTTGYEDFGDTAGVVLWRGTEANFHASTVINVAADGTLGDPYVMVANANNNTTSWQRFASNQNNAYTSPGILLVYDTPGTGDGYKYNPNCTFGPLSFGGMWVKTLAINGLPFSILGSGDRKTEFGASGKSTLFKFDASYTIDRSGTTTFYGDATVDIAQGATCTAQANSSHVVAVDSAATLKLKGAGTLAVTTMNVAGTLDLSAATVPTISGNVAFAGNATLVLPAGTNPTTEAPLTVCSGTLSTAGVVYVKVGDAEPAAAELTINGGAITGIDTGIQTEQTFTSDYPSVVPAGYTYTYEATEAVTIPAVTVNGTLKTSGPITITDFAIAAGANLEVVAGNTTVGNGGGTCQLKGNIKIDAGATLTNTKTDTLDYGGAMTVDVYGTLAMGTTRWSVPGDCTFKLHAGATVTGAGDSLASLDFISGASRGLDVYAGEGTGSVTIEGKMRVRANETRIWIADNTTLVLSSGICDGGGHHAGFKQVGPGTLEIHANSVGLSGNDSIMTQGTLRLVDTTLAFPVALQGNSSYLEVVATEATTTVPVKVTSIANNNVTLSGAGKVSGSITKTSAPDGDLATALQSSAWTGTFVADWEGAKASQFDINSYGNANSVVEVTKLAGGYVSGSNANVTVVPTVNVSGTMKLDNGYSNKTTTFTRLTGSGTFTQGGIYPIDIDVLDGFTGTIVGESSGGTSIATINLSVTPSVGDKLFSISPSSEILYNFAATKVSVNGVVDDTIKLEAKNDGIYVKAPVANVTSADGQTVTPYYTVAEAFEAVDDGETLTLVGTAVTLASDVTVEKSYTLAGDAQGTTVTGSGKIYLTGSTELTLAATLTSVGNQFYFSSKDAKLTFPTAGFTPVVRPYTAGGCQTGTTVNGDGTTTYYQYLFLQLQVGASNVTLAYYDSGDLLVTKQVFEGDEIVFTATPAEGYENPVVTANGNTLTPVDGKYTVVVGTVSVAIQATASQISDTYEITSETTLGEGGTLNIGSATKIKIGTYDVTAGFRIDGTTATLLAPEIVEETNKKAIDVGATTVTLNVDLVPGLYYGVASGTGLTLTRPETLTQYTGSNDADILAVTKPSAEKGFFKVFVDIKE